VERGLASGADRRRDKAVAGEGEGELLRLVKWLRGAQLCNVDLGPLRNGPRGAGAACMPAHGCRAC
jgi:hypothetical protein